MLLPHGGYGIFGFSPTFTHFHPFSHLLIFTMDSHTLMWALRWGDGLPGFCLTTVECPMRGRIPADEEVWLYHKLKTEVAVDSLLQETLPSVQSRTGWTHTRLWD